MSRVIGLLVGNDQKMSLVVQIGYVEHDGWDDGRSRPAIHVDFLVGIAGIKQDRVPAFTAVSADSLSLTIVPKNRTTG